MDALEAIAEVQLKGIEGLWLRPFQRVSAPRRDVQGRALIAPASSPDIALGTGARLVVGDDPVTLAQGGALRRPVTSG